MPLYKTIQVNSQTNVKIWHIVESLDFLMSNTDLKEESRQRVQKMKSELHQRAFLSVRLLLKAFGYSDLDLIYDEYGKPHLKNGLFISISHSYTYAAVVISTSAVGVDIEKQRHKITAIASKFIGYEAAYLNINSEHYIKQLTWIWCIKESLYKLYAKLGVSFKEQMLVLPIGADQESTTAWILDKNQRQRFEALVLEFNGFGFAITTPSK